MAAAVVDDGEGDPFLGERSVCGVPCHRVEVDGAERDVVPDLLQEAAAFSATLGEPATRAALAAFMAAGGQTPAGELRLADLVAPAPGFT